MKAPDRALLAEHAADLRRLADAYTLNATLAGRADALAMAARVRRIADLIAGPEVVREADQPLLLGAA